MASVDLTPRPPRKAYGGDGGIYYEWSPADLPMLEVASIGAAKLSLAAGGLSLPSYSDSGKVAYVLQGKGTCGIVLPEATKEKVVAVKEGDALALPFGVVTWWHNLPESTTELVVLFLGDTSKGHKAGQFTNFQLTGATGIFTGFFTARLLRESPRRSPSATAPHGFRRATRRSSSSRTAGRSTTRQRRRSTTATPMPSPARRRRTSSPRRRW